MVGLPLADVLHIYNAEMDDPLKKKPNCVCSLAKGLTERPARSSISLKAGTRIIIYTIVCISNCQRE